MKKFILNPYVLIVSSYVAYILIGYLWLYKHHNHFVNTNFYFASVTFGVGAFALFVYLKQKFDEKSNAATTVLLEIRNAESKVEIIIDKLDKNNAVDLPSVLPTNSWRKYSHLFVKDFDLDDIQLLNAFYTRCEIIEDLVNRQNNFVWITTEERAKTVQRILGQIHDDFQIESLLESKPAEGEITKAQKKFSARQDAVNRIYGNEPGSYAPDKILRGLKFQTQFFEKVTSTPCGAKLKNIANL